MDQPDADPDELAESLRDLGAVNRWLGGRFSAISHTLDIVARIPRSPATILDVGTGGGDVPLALAARARRQGVDLRIIATDLHPRTLAFTREATSAEPWIEVRRANALDLPFADGAVDIVMCCTMLHHFSDDEVVRVLREMNRVARHGLVVTDLARSKAALAGAALLAQTAWRYHPITRHDGPASVRAAFNAREMRELARTAGVEGRVRVTREPGFRLALVGDRTVVPVPFKRTARSRWRWRAEAVEGAHA